MKIHALAITAVLSSAVLLAPASAEALRPAGIGSPPASESYYVAPTTDPCAVSVTPFLSATRTDDTGAFAQAISTALSTSPACYPAGPTGAPQAVVTVPAGVYRIANLRVPSNVRLEVSAAATLEEPANKNAQPEKIVVPLMFWGAVSRSAAPVVNVSLVGVGSDVDAQKAAAQAMNGAIAGFDLSTDFTMNLDPVSTDSTNNSRGIDVTNAHGFLIENVFTVQNGTDQPMSKKMPWPTSASAVFDFHALKGSPVAGPFIQPANGSVEDVVEIGAPRGFGPTQVNAGVGLHFQDLYSDGGTVLRIETDDSMNGHGALMKGATVDQLTAEHIVGTNCNRAVSLAPHAQHNGSVSVDDVWAYSCNEAVVANVDGKVPPARAGDFTSALVTDVHVQAGPAAQLDSSAQLWTVGQSFLPTFTAPTLTWQPQLAVVDQSGSFSGQH